MQHHKKNCDKLKQLKNLDIINTALEKTAVEKI